jgi:uncharacterized protein YbjQ (UPF0145 family)
MKIPIFIGSISQSDYDDAKLYKKAGSVSITVGRHISFSRRYLEEIRSIFGIKDLFQTKMADQALEDAYNKLINEAIKKYYNAVAIVNAEIDYDFDVKYIHIHMSGVVVVPRDQPRNNILSSQEKEKKNKASRKASRKEYRKNTRKNRR